MLASRIAVSDVNKNKISRQRDSTLYIIRFLFFKYTSLHIVTNKAHLGLKRT